mmetsp:Transcript_84053/g.235508  ORF Transcript_84053/g.235508 Transcript_84053/m.235508 type:complete len:270 (+) Transcript_84053:789-1598(+)
MRSLKSAFSSLRFSVASATAESKALMPFSNAAISSVSWAMDSSAAAMAASRSDTFRSSSFFLSSLVSSVVTQYSFFVSSSACSVFSDTIISSMSLMTFSKPTFLPWSAKKMVSKRARSETPAKRKPSFNSATARALVLLALTCVCRKLLAPGLGNVALKSSRASSSFKTLIVSAKATNSSARSLQRASHSVFFFSQPSSKFAMNFWSAARASCVSSRSFAFSARAMPSSATRAVFFSMAWLASSFSFVFAAMSSSKTLIADSSVSVAAL